MGSVVAGLIILTKTLLKDKLNASWHYYIWFLLVIRLVVPYAPQTSFSIFNLVPKTSLNSIENYVVPSNTDVNSGIKDIFFMDDIHKERASSNGEEISLNKNTIKNDGVRYLHLLWIIGVLAVLMYNLVVYLSLLNKVKSMPKCTDANIISILDQCRRRVSVKKKPDIICCTDSKGPSLMGYFKPKIIISPQVLSYLSKEDLEHIFLHEMMHIKRKDILANWIMIVVQAFHWFNPIVWYAFSKMRKDREIICDAWVLARLEPEKRKNYGNTIISLVEILSSSYWRPGIVGMAKNKSEMELLSKNEKIADFFLE